jgi:mono/diheme cytochrome c family protein
MQNSIFFSLVLTLPSVAFTAAAASKERSVGTPTFNRDIAPILYKNCSNCHRPGEVAPFALLTYEDAAKRAKQIAAITQARVMPPWKATPGFGEFLDERRLTEQQIATLRDWAMHGAPEGDLKEKPAPPSFATGWMAGQPDQVIEMTQPYSVPAEGPDQFRCFVVPLNASEDEYVNTVEFRAGNPKIVHHAILFLDSSGEARKREEAPGKGYDCVGGPGLDITGALGGWAPGATPATSRPGIAVTIKKGSDLVMQVHYHLDGKPEQDQSKLGLKFSKEPPTKGLTLFVLGNQRIDIPPGDNQYVVKASGVIPMDSEAIAIFPHAHYLCKDMKVDAHLPDGAVLPLIWIKDWDFNWQGAYRYASTVKLPKGTRLEMQYIYDNSAANPHNPSNPPREVKFGEQTTNEMAFAFVSLTLDSPAQVPEFRAGMRAELIASMLEQGVDEEALGPERAGKLKMLLNAFDKNHNGKIDPEERQAVVDFLIKRAQQQEQQPQQPRQ